MLAGFMLTGIPFSIYYNEDDLIPLLISGLITFATGFLIYIFTRKADNRELRKREGYIIVSLSWLIMAFFGSLPFIIHGSIPNFTDAFFETMSGFTTTGASILDDIESMPHGLLFWRSITQWLGGMGIIVLSLALLPIWGIGGMQLFIAEVPGITKDKLHPRIKETAKRLWAIYCILTVAQTILLLIGGMNLFDAVNHSFTTMATGGFSTKQNSIAYFDSPFIQYVIVFFMFLAGTSFTLHYYAMHGKFSVFKESNEFKFYVKVVGFITLAVTIMILFHHNIGYEKAFRDSLFQVVSLITTTGYVTADYELWSSFSQIIFFFLLFVGGCAGSTGGGIKIIRHYVLYKNSALELKRIVHPRAIIPVRINNKAVSSDIISNVLAFFLFYIIVFVFGSIIMALIGLDFLSAIGSVATTLGNIGPGIATVGPVGNFAHIPDTGKWFLSFLMLLGRLELFTIIVIFSPAFWKS